MLDDLLDFLPKGFLHRELLTAHLVMLLSSFCVGLTIPIKDLLRGMTKLKIIFFALASHLIWMSFVIFNLALAVYDDQSTIKGLVILACAPVSLFVVTVAAVARLHVPAIFAAVMLSSILHDISGNFDIAVWNYIFSDSGANISSINLESKSASALAFAALGAPLILGSILATFLPGAVRKIAEYPVLLSAIATVVVTIVTVFTVFENTAGIHRSFMHAGLLVLIGYPLVLCGVFSVSMFAGLKTTETVTVILGASMTSIPYGLMVAVDNFVGDYGVTGPLLWWELIQAPAALAMAFITRRYSLLARKRANSDHEAAVTA